MMHTVTIIDGVSLYSPSVHHEFRGEITSLFGPAHGIDVVFAEDKIAVSRKHVLRGFHADGVTYKFMASLRGGIYVVLVDARKESLTYGKHETFLLSDKNRYQLFVPPGVFNAHLCMDDECIFWYKWSVPYSGPDNQQTLAWNDKTVNVFWPIDDPILSERDTNGLSFSEVGF